MSVFSPLYFTLFFWWVFFLFREFIEKQYLSLKKEHPTLPILVREAQGVPARLFARFGKCLYFFTNC